MSRGLKVTHPNIQALDTFVVIVYPDELSLPNRAFERRSIVETRCLIQNIVRKRDAAHGK